MHASVPYRMIDDGSSELKVAPLLDIGYGTVRGPADAVHDCIENNWNF